MIGICHLSSESTLGSGAGRAVVSGQASGGGARSR